MEITSFKVRGKLAAKIEELSGQRLLSCYQCGKCTAGCPSASAMDISPNQIIRQLQVGDESVLDSMAIWLCVSCFTCASRCPKGVDLSKILESLRQIKLRRNVDRVAPSRLSEEDLSRLPQIALVSNFRKFTA